jgi:hypothetical protein
VFDHELAKGVYEGQGIPHFANRTSHPHYIPALAELQKVWLVFLKT